ncbi:hypothetical protein [uncultured Algibacter sp.]|uniref:hypothetical protein n=1 Tax=uncultured Algibacter sp. TaxID=298659 RepID=UPI0030EC56E3|tara:strand:- start:841 stop:1611 length:771 start_codon:yes stop_codon:yes gene_type:complete
MIKKTISLITMLAITLSVVSTVNAQEDDSYAMWESIMLSPDHTKLKVLGDNMKAHNAKYHKAGTYDATVYNIVSGPNAGKIVWMMGPMNYKHNDTRPSKGGHDEDWRDNVMPYVKKMHTIEYWKANAKLSNTSMMDGDASAYPLLFVRYHEIEKGQIPGAFAFLEYVSKTIKKMKGENPWGVYVNEFRQGDLGRHIATVGFMKNWAEMDEDDNDFKKVFDEVNGEENWELFRDLGSNSFSNSWDEMWSYNAHMSGK